ncbi:centromere protein T [Pimephales promelas]|uniref:centromere protein T n=1 Tax=Pimephales promelas TaxID=90988 RepID=UPI001955BD89|nr:centromere protein T [Pimephales promelas]KAG1958631.1 centromere protein T [Pimephales promelas]
MDSTEEDISARVLLRRVLHTELPRSPVTRSSTSVRRSMRVKNTPGVESPGSALRHRLKKKLHESASLSPLPSPKRQRSMVAPGPSPLHDEDMTTRGLLRGIMQMETEASLLMSGQPAQVTEPNPAESSVSSTGERTEGLSGVELSDLTLNTEPLTHVVRGLSRRKPQSAFSVSAFERQFDQLPDNTKDVSHVSHRGDGPQEKPDTSHDLDLSAGSKSGLNLTLKTPFVDKRSERAGLQRKVSNRKLPSVDAFDEAVQRCLEQGPKQDHSVVQDGKTLEDSSWQKFTLGLNDVTELYVHSKKDETVGPSQREAELVPSSQEAGDDVFLTPGDYIVLASTQAMTESLPESQNVELHDQESIVEIEDENAEGEVEKENVVEEVEDENAEEEVKDENVEEEVEDENAEEEVEDENAEEEVEDENAEEEVEDENAEEEVEDENAEEEVEDENAEEKVEDENVEEEVEDENVVEVEDENLEEEVEDENVVEVEDENVEEENPDASHHPERITRRAHRSEGGGAVPGVPASTRVTKSFGAGLNPREKDHLEFVDGNRDSLQDVVDEGEQAGSPVAEVTTTKRRSSHRKASLAEEDLPELAEHHDAPEEVSQSEEELMDSEPANQSREQPQEEEEEDDDGDSDALSAELSMKTPAFVRQKRVFASPSVQAMPTVLKEVNAGPPQVTKRAPRKKRQAGVDVLPKSYIMSVFKHFAKTKVASDVYPVVNEFLKKYFERLADDLEVYATHAKRKTIEIEDFELLMRRQGFVTDGTPVNILIEKYLPLEYRKLLIPVATSGNKVIPTQRR